MEDLGTKPSAAHYPPPVVSEIPLNLEEGPDKKRLLKKS